LTLTHTSSNSHQSSNSNSTERRDKAQMHDKPKRTLDPSADKTTTPNAKDEGRTQNNACKHTRGEKNRQTFDGERERSPLPTGGGMPPAGGRCIGRHPRQGGGAGARVRSCRAGRPFAGPPRAQPHKALALDSVIWYSTCNSNTNIPDVSVARRDTHGRSQSLRGSEERVRRVRSASFTVFIPTKNSVFLNTLL